MPRDRRRPAPLARHKENKPITIRSAIIDPPVRWWHRFTRAFHVKGHPQRWRIGVHDWVRILARSVAGAIRDDFGIAASSIAFAAFLSVLPLLSLVTLVYGMVVSPATTARDVATLIAILPGSAGHFVDRWLTNSLNRHDGGLVALLLSAGITLFSARRAGQSLIHGLEVASTTRQDRGPLARLLVAMAVVLVGASLLFAALLSMSALALIQALLPTGVPGVRLGFTLLLWASLTLGPSAALVLIFRYAIGQEPVPWAWTVPGTVTAVVLWIGATLLFRFYVSNLASYNSTYGSLSAVIVLLLWLMLSAYALLFGARVNAEAMRAAGVAHAGS